MTVKFRECDEVLGVPRRATADEIKKAYRQRARTQLSPSPDLTC